jgi:DNA repair protein RadC
VQHNAIDLARLVLQQVGGVVGLYHTSPAVLMAIPGIGAQKASRILAAVELSRRLQVGLGNAAPLLNTPTAIYNCFAPLLRHQPIEVLYAVFLSNSLHLAGFKPLGSGTHDQVPVFIKEVIKHIITGPTAQVVLLHNHLEANPVVTDEDIALTGELRRRCQWFDIELAGHLILGEQGWSMVTNPNSE